MKLFEIKRLDKGRVHLFGGFTLHPGEMHMEWEVHRLFEDHPIAYVYVKHTDTSASHLMNITDHVSNSHTWAFKGAMTDEEYLSDQKINLIIQWLKKFVISEAKEVKDGLIHLKGGYVLKKDPVELTSGITFGIKRLFDPEEIGEVGMIYDSGILNQELLFTLRLYQTSEKKSLRLDKHGSKEADLKALYQWTEDALREMI